MVSRETYPNFPDDPDLQKLVEALQRDIDGRTYRSRRQSAVVAATYECSGVDEVIHVDYTATGSVIINLPLATRFQGRSLVVNDRGGSAGSNNIVLKEGGVTIHTISTNDQCITIASDGGDWYIEGKN